MLSYNRLMGHQPHSSSGLSAPLGNCFRSIANVKFYENPMLKLVNDRIADTHSVGGFFVEQTLRKILHEFVFTKRQLRAGS